MGAPVLTSADQLTCSHGFPVTVLPSPTCTLAAGGNPVLVQADLSSAVFACTVQVPCKSVASTLSGLSQVLTADGSAVLLAGAQGATNAGTWNAVTPGSPQLEA
jgi:hypothetical protein